MKLCYREMTVLLVGADSSGLDAFGTQLEDFQFQRLLNAPSDESALENLKSRPVDLVICQWNLDVETGLDLVEKMRQDPALKEVPVLVTAAHRDKEIEQKAGQKGVTGFLNLPLEADAVRLTVEQVLAPFIDEEKEEFLQQVAKARQAERDQDFDKAEQAYRAALAVRADENTRLDLGHILRQKGDLSGAEQEFELALKKNPRSLRAFLGLALVYQSMNRPEDALTILAGVVTAAKKMKESGTLTASIYFYMGEIELQLKHLKEAMGLFNKAANTLPGDAELRTRIGDTLSQAGFLAESEKFYQRALELDPELAHVYNRLGIAYRRQGKFKLALNLYAKALAFHPQDENLHYNTARCYFDMKDFHKASEELLTALKVNPNFSEAQLLLTKVVAEIGRKAKPDDSTPPSTN